MAIRIWHQSFTDITKLPGYKSMLQNHASGICEASTSVDVHGVKPGTYPEGMAPIDMVAYRWAHHLVFVQVVENAMRAEREGYDAVAISCFVDPGLALARSVTNIPILSSLENSLLVSSLIGRSFGLIALDEAMAETVTELIREYGYEDRVAVVAPLDPPINEFELDEAFAGSKMFVERFSRQARELIAAGADVIIPAEGVLNTVLVRNGLQAIDGVPVLDSYGALLAQTEAMVRLQRSTGLSVSRKGIYRQPPQSLVDHLRGLTADILLSAKREAGAGAPAKSAGDR